MDGAAVIRWRRRLRRAAGDQRGLTVVELVVTMGVLSLVLGSVFSTLHVLMRNDRYQEALINNQEKVRFALIEMARDIRNANPMEHLHTVDEYANKIEVTIGPSAGTQTHVRWELTSAGEIYRRVLDAPRGNPTSSRLVLRNVDNASTTTPLFRYYDENGVEITTVQTVGDYANCTIRVHIRVVAADDPVGSEFSESTDAELRNLLPGGIGC